MRIFHSVLSGHRFTKAGQRKHAFRLYKQAEQVFASKGWNLAEDHIQYTISKQAITLKKLEEATICLSHLLRPSSLQSTQQQAGFLREYLATHKTLISQSNNDELLNISVPKIVQNSIRVLVTSPANEVLKDFVPATNIDIHVSLHKIINLMKKLFVSITLFRATLTMNGNGRNWKTWSFRLAPKSN